MDQTPEVSLGSAARAMCEKRPPQTADRNPLLGRGTRPGSTRPATSVPLTGLQALAKGGLCQVLSGGGGVFGFRPDGPNRVNWTGENCVLVRAEPAPNAAAGASPAVEGRQRRPIQRSIEDEFRRGPRALGQHTINEQQCRGPQALGIETGCAGRVDCWRLHLDPGRQCASERVARATRGRPLGSRSIPLLRS